MILKLTNIKKPGSTNGVLGQYLVLVITCHATVYACHRYSIFVQLLVLPDDCRQSCIVTKVKGMAKYTLTQVLIGIFVKYTKHWKLLVKYMIIGLQSEYVGNPKKKNM